jgi:hypothetical protein
VINFRYNKSVNNIKRLIGPIDVLADTFRNTQISVMWLDFKRPPIRAAFYVVVLEPGNIRFHKVDLSPIPPLPRNTEANGRRTATSSWELKSVNCFHTQTPNAVKCLRTPQLCCINLLLGANVNIHRLLKYVKPLLLKLLLGLSWSYYRNQLCFFIVSIHIIN